MNRDKSIVLVLSAFAFASCVVVDESVPGAASGEVTSENGSAGWQAGYSKGESDGRGGLSRTPDRYGSIYSEADRDEFFRGYEAGYNQGIKR